MVTCRPDVKSRYSAPIRSVRRAVPVCRRRAPESSIDACPRRQACPCRCRLPQLALTSIAPTGWRRQLLSIPAMPRCWTQSPPDPVDINAVVAGACAIATDVWQPALRPSQLPIIKMNNIPVILWSYNDDGSTNEPMIFRNPQLTRSSTHAWTPAHYRLGMRQIVADGRHLISGNHVRIGGGRQSGKSASAVAIRGNVARNMQC